MANMAKGTMRKMAGSATLIEGGEKDATVEQVAIKEEKVWVAKGEEQWESYKKARPYNLQGYEAKYPKAGEAAPDGEVFPFKAGDATTLLAEVKKLANDKKKVGIIFGSATCPAFRTFGGFDFHKAFVAKGYPILYVYTREAHGHDDFESAMNLGSPFALKKTINMATSMDERRAAAVLLHAHMVTQLKGKIEDVQVVLDNMDDTLEKAYEARPYRAYVIDTDTEKITYAGGLAPFNMAAKLRDIAALE